MKGNSEGFGKVRMPAIAFGLDRQTDETSLVNFFRLFSSQEFLEVLVPRLSDEDIMSLVEHMTRLMKKHLDEKEYHHLFLDKQ